MADGHSELLAYLTSIDGKVDAVASDVKAIQATLNDKVNQSYCVGHCQPRWVPRSYVVGGSIAGGFIIGVLAFFRDLQAFMAQIAGK